METAHSLFQRPMYQSTTSGQWFPFISDAIGKEQSLNWNPAGILATLSYGYPFGNTTLFREIQRQPWLSELDANGDSQEMPIPPHGLLGGSAKAIGKRLMELMCAEAEKACRNRKQVYILLSGGLDSRVVAGVVHHLVKTGKITSEIKAVTWGVENCRDVFYGKCVAERLGFSWFHAELSQSQYFRNIDLCASSLGASVSPAHLHRMNWFEGVDKDSLVLAGSLGNMIGRGQITSRSMLEVLPLRPFNYMKLMNQEAAVEGLVGCDAEIQSLRSRAGKGLENYVYHEQEQAAHFSRGMLCQTMSIINQYCDVYQMLSSKDIYSFMWSRHPAVRTDQVYTEVLELVGNEIAAVPWTRTNKAVKGTFDAPSVKLKKDHNEYRNWTHNYLNSNSFDRDDFLNRISKTHLFNMSILEQAIVNYESDSEAYSVEANQFPWLVGWLISMDKMIKDMPDRIMPWTSSNSIVTIDERSIQAPRARSIRRFFANNAWLRNKVAQFRRSKATSDFLKKHPVQPDPNLSEK